MFDNKDERFYKKKCKGVAGTIIVDRETGVNYLFKKSGYAGGMTVLVDHIGKPIVTPKEEML